MHGHKVDGDSQGLQYLRSLNDAEAKPLFDEVHLSGKVRFKHNDHHFEMTRTPDHVYLVAEVQSSGGIF